MPEGSRESERAMRRRRERMVREQWLDVREEWERTNNRGGNHDAGHVSARPLEDSVVEEAAQGALSAQPALNPSRLRHRCLRESRINRSDNVRGVKWLEKTLVPPMCCREKKELTRHTAACFQPSDLDQRALRPQPFYSLLILWPRRLRPHASGRPAQRRQQRQRGSFSALCT